MSRRTRATERAVAKYTESSCIRAFVLNTKMGEGAASIALCHDVANVTTTRAADAAINAGREITERGEA